MSGTDALAYLASSSSPILRTNKLERFSLARLFVYLLLLKKHVFELSKVIEGTIEELLKFHTLGPYSQHLIFFLTYKWVQ
jgi:hypothetical protein